MSEYSPVSESCFAVRENNCVDPSAEMHQIMTEVKPVEGSIGLGDQENLEREELMKRHLKLVEIIARKLSKWNIDYGDRCEAGLFGLYKAGRDFDPAKGVKFTTFATRYIRTEIYMAARRSNEHNSHSIPLSPIDNQEDGSFDSDFESIDDSALSSPAVNVQRIELIKIMRKGLPPQYWKIISMSLKGYTSEETASKLGAKNATIRTRLDRARNQLKNNPKVIDYRDGYAA